MTKDQIEDIVSQFKDICDLKATSPFAQNLWDVNDEEEFLDDVKADFFYSLTDKLLYIKNRTRTEI